jgi:integrase
MGKRGNGEGSIYPHVRDGKKVGYRGAYTVLAAAGPKRRYVSGKTREEVRRKLAKAVADRDGGIVYDAGSMTVGEYLNAWLRDSVRGTVRQRTYERYEGIVRVHLVPSIGRTKLKALAPAHVRGLYREKIEGNPAEGVRPLAPRTVLHVHRTLSKALKQAHDDGMIPRNPAGSVKPPRPRKEEIRPLDPEQVRNLFDAADSAEDRNAPLYVLAVTAGLRRGELLGLRWEDVDLEAGSLQVRRTLSEPKGGFIFEAPKSGKGRLIRLTRKAQSALKAHRKRQLEERMERAGLWQENGLIFPSRVGTPMSGGNLTRAFKAALRRAGLPNTSRFHDMRHTCATLLLRQGVNPKYVSDLLGHADVSLTLNVYSHVLPDMGDAAAGAMDAALG